MHIAIDARLYGLQHAGIGRYILNLIHNLAKQDKKNKYTFIVAPNTKIEKLPVNHQVIVSDVRHYSFQEQTQFLQQINRIDCDLFHFPHFNVPLFYNKPFVVTIHDVLWHEKKGFSVTTLHPLKYLVKYTGYRAVVRHAVKQAESILVPTEHVKQILVDKFNLPISQVQVTYEAADKIYSTHTPKKSVVTKKYKIQTPYVCYTGSLYPHKNVITVVKALQKMPNLQLVLASARNVFTEKFMRQVDSLGLSKQVTLLGFVPDEDLVSFYNQAVALVLPSESEGFGLTGLEAMSAGCPVVCSDNPVLREIYGEVAMFVDSSDPNQFVTAFKKLSEDNKLRKKLISQGKQQTEKYSWEKMTQETIQTYNQQ